MTRIMLSKPKLTILIMLVLFFVIPSLTVVRGLYNFSLPSNTLFADDFNSYSSGTDLRNGYGTGVNGCPTTGGTANQCAGKYGWGWYDNGAGGYAHVATNNSYSGPQAMEMASSTAVSPNGKFDIHHMVPTLNTTTVVNLSVYFAFDNFTRNGSGGNNEMTFSIETWDYVNKYECNVFLFPAAATVQIDSTDSVPVVNLRTSAYDDTRFIYGTGNWHHIGITCDIKNKVYLAASIDNWDILAQMAVTRPHMQSLPDVEMIVGTKPFTIPARIEFAQINGVTSGLHVWKKWVDDIVVTDATSISTCGPLCLSAINLSAWFGILMVTVGAGTSSSLYFGAARMLRGEPFKSKEVVALMFAGVLGVLAFGVMMAVAVGLIKIIPGG